MRPAVGIRLTMSIKFVILLGRHPLPGGGHQLVVKERHYCSISSIESKLAHYMCQYEVSNDLVISQTRAKTKLKRFVVLS